MIGTALLHLWLILAVFLFGMGWSLTMTCCDLARLFALAFGWPITAPAIWLINRWTR
jgi:hypothetical protein